MTTKTETEKNSNINECLLKSFDNLMYQQSKMDNKAYIFIGFLIFIFNTFFKNTNNIYSIILFIVSIPLICSLVPIATKFGITLVKLLKKDDTKNEHNIFYYIDICGLTKERFIQVLKNEYGIQELSLSDKKLVEQIIINSEILSAKVFWHTLSLKILIIGILAPIILNLIQYFI